MSMGARVRGVLDQQRDLHAVVGGELDQQARDVRLDGGDTQVQLAGTLTAPEGRPSFAGIRFSAGITAILPELDGA